MFNFEKLILNLNRKTVYTVVNRLLPVMCQKIKDGYYYGVQGNGLHLQISWQSVFLVGCLILVLVLV